MNTTLPDACLHKLGTETFQALSATEQAFVKSAMEALID